MGMIIRWHISTPTSKHPERDGENGQDRNVLLAEHISLIIIGSAMAGEFGVTGDTLSFKYVSNGSPRWAFSYLRHNNVRNPGIGSQEDGPLVIHNWKNALCWKTWCFLPFCKVELVLEVVACVLGPVDMPDNLGKCPRYLEENEALTCLSACLYSLLLLGRVREISLRDKKRKTCILYFFKRRLLHNN